MELPALRTHVFFGGLVLGFLFLFQPAWVGGFAFAWVAIFLSRLLFTALARLWPGLLGLWALGKHLGLAGLAVGGILGGLSPIGVVVGLALWPLSLWIWAVRHVRHSR